MEEVLRSVNQINKDLIIISQLESIETRNIDLINWRELE